MTKPIELCGFYTKHAREYGHNVLPATTTMYTSTPLVDLLPPDPNAMITATPEAQRHIFKFGQI